MESMQEDGKNGKLDNINWNKYQKESIDFILAEAEKAIKESIESYRQVNNKIYFAFTAYSSVAVFAITRLMKLSEISSGKIFLPVSTILFIGAVLGIGCVFKKLFNADMVLPGTAPSFLIHEYYENRFENGQDIYYKKIAIENMQGHLEMNALENADRIKQLRLSIYCFTLACALFAITVCTCACFNRGLLLI